MNNAFYLMHRMTPKERKLFPANIKFAAFDMVDKHGVNIALSNTQREINIFQKKIRDVTKKIDTEKEATHRMGSANLNIHDFKESLRQYAFRIYQLKLVRKSIIRTENDEKKEIVVAFDEDAFRYELGIGNTATTQLYPISFLY